MELKVDLPALRGQDIDPNTFQRVWDRVMPNQPAPRSDAIPDSAVPAQPTEPPEETPPVEPPPVEPPEEEQPPVTPDLPPVPGCPAEPVCPDCPACPDCPQCPDCPDCPACPDVPVTPDAPTFCLGEASQGDAARLEALMTLAQSGAAAARAMTRRASGACARALAVLACDHRSAFRRLSAAYFLITGRRYAPRCAAPTLPASLPLALRQQFLWEQQWEQQNKQAAQATADPCLRELYLELAQEGAYHAGTIRSLLEQMA